MVDGCVSEVLLFHNTLIINKIIHSNTKGKPRFAFCYFIKFSQIISFNAKNNTPK